MERPSKRPELGDALKASVDYARRSREGLAQGLLAARAAHLDPPPTPDHVRRFLWGFALPVSILRVAWRDPRTRARIFVALQAPMLCVTLATCVGVVWIARGVMHPGPTTATIAIGDEDRADDDGDSDAPSPTSHAPPAHPAMAAAVAPAPSAPGRFAALRTVFDVLTSRVVQVLAILGVLEWILVWIGREHHDQITHDASVLTGVPGEPFAGPPRLHFDFAWLWMKLWRAVRFLLFLALDGPVVWLVNKIPVAGGVLAGFVEVAWTVYWAAVFAVANAFLAWEPAAPDEVPWFIRVLRSVGCIPILGIPARVYAWALTLATRKVWPACLAFERTTWESMGLAAVRALASVPFLYLVLRPMFGPAATHALVARSDALVDTA